MISSVQNAVVKSVTKLHQKKYRDLTGHFIVDGTHELVEALKTYTPEHLFSLDEKYTQVSPHVMKKLAGGIIPEVLGVFKKKPAEAFKGNVLVLEHIQDPGNVGSLLRSARAFGFHTVMAIGGVDLYHPKVVRSSEGYFFPLNLIVTGFEDALIQLKGYHHLRAQAGNHAVKPIQEPVALWLGNEGQGLSKEALALKGSLISVKTDHVESLNVAVAGSILMHQLKNG